MAKVMKSLVMYGETFGADKMVPVTSEYGHTVISFGIGVMKPVYDLYDQLIEAGALSRQKFSADPLPLDKNVPSSFLQDLIFKHFMYSQQGRYEKQLEKLGGGLTFPHKPHKHSSVSSRRPAPSAPDPRTIPKARPASGNG